MQTIIDPQELATALGEDARALILHLRGRKRRASIVVNEYGCEASYQAKRGAEELVTLGCFELGVQVPTDDARLVCKREYRWTETGKRVRDAVLDAVEGGAS